LGTIRKVDKVAEATTGGAALEKLGDVAKGAPEGSADKGAKLASGIEANKTGINALAELHPISPNASGGISSAKLNSSSYALIDLTPAEQSMARQVAVQGDQAGAITERLVNSVAQRQGMTILDGGKYGSNNGFDHVFQNADGTVTILLDSKQIVRGSTSLAEGAGGKMQLSSDWIRNVLLKVDQTSPAYQAVNAALNNGTLVKGVAGIDRMTGALTVVRVK
jgi:filamentous hemagglutinin